MASPFFGSMKGIAYGNGVWVAVGQSGMVRTSADGANWATQTITTTTGTTLQFNGVAFGTVAGQGLFVAVGSYFMQYPPCVVYQPPVSTCSNPPVGQQRIYTSPDGINWAAQTTQVPYNSALLGVAYGTPGGVGKFLAVGAGGVATTSLDGVSWVSQTTGTTSTLQAVGFGNGQFVAVGASGTARTSPDGSAWTGVSSGTTQTLYGVAWGSNLWVAVGSGGTIRYSTNGATWTAAAQPAPTPNYSTSTTWYGVAHGGGRWIVVSNSMYANATSFSSPVITSTDGVAWQYRPATTYYFYGPQAVAHGAGQFVAVGYYNIIRSPNGLDWISTHNYVGYVQNGIASSGPQWVSVGYYGSIYNSPNGVQWTRRHSGLPWSYTLEDVAYGAGKWVAVGSSGRIVTSVDSVAWTPVTSPSGATLYGVGFRAGQWVAVGTGGTVLTSPDGAAWTIRTSGTTQPLYSVAYGGGKWLAVGPSGMMRSSPDGITWSAVASPNTATLYDVAYDSTAPADKWVVVGSGGTLMSSWDTSYWNVHSSGTTSTLYSVARGNGLWVAAGGSWVTSSWDASIWTPWTASNIGSSTYALAASTVPPLSCLPATQTVGLNAPATVGGGGGQVPYTWTAPGSNSPGPASGALVTRTYAALGTYYVALTDSSSPPASVQCEVIVVLNPPVPPVPPVPPGPPPGCGYRVRTTETDPGLYNWQEIAPALGGGGTAIAGQSYSSTRALQPSPGFNFTLCGSNYQTFWLSGAGYICMGPTNVPTGQTWGSPSGCTSYSAVGLPNSLGPSAAVYGFWGLINPSGCAGGSGTCNFYKVTGTTPNRVLIYEFRNVPLYSNAPPLQTFQIKLFEATSCMEVHFQNTQQPDSNWLYWPWYGLASGYEGPAAGIGWQYAYSPTGTPPPGMTRANQAWSACPVGAQPDSYRFNEDQAAQAFDVTANHDNGDGETFTVASWTNPTKGTLVRTGGLGGFTYQPYADRNGADAFTYTIVTPTGKTWTAPVSLTINALNDAPSFEPAVPVVAALPSEGAKVVPGFGYLVTPGPTTATDEATQGVTFTVASNSNPALFSVAPTLQRTNSATSTIPVSPNTSGAFAVLRFTPTGVTGKATVCFRAQDTGGVATGTNSWGVTVAGVSLGAPRCFDIVENLPPTAYFMPSTATPMPGQAVTFDSCPGAIPSCSFDPNDSIVTYLWEFGDGAKSAMQLANHAYAKPGAYVVRLSVWDAFGASHTVTRVIVVGAPASGTADDGPLAARLAPTADAGGERKVPEGSTVMLAGSQLGGGAAATFGWTQVAGPKVLLDDASSATPTFRAPWLKGTDPVDLIFSLRVADGAAVSVPSYAIIQVVSTNHAPVADAGGSQQAPVLGLVTLDGSRSLDQDSDLLTYQWEQVYSSGDIVVTLADATQPTTTFMAPETPGILQFRLRVSDGKTSSEDTAIVDVAPFVGKAALSFTYRVTPAAGGADVTFEAPAGVTEATWSFGDGTEGAGPTATHHYEAPGTYEVTLTSGPEGQTESSTQQVSVWEPMANASRPGNLGTAPWLALLVAGMALVAGLVAVAVLRRSRVR